MRKSIYFLFIFTIMLACKEQKKEARDYKILPVNQNHIELTDSFWKSRLETNSEVTIPYCFEKCEETHRIANFEVAGGLVEGTHFGKRYNDSDVFKIMEGAAYSLQQNYDLELDKYLDELISKVAAAQEDDGYLYTIRTIKPDSLTEYEGFKRWEKVRMHSHELYNVGHMYEAAVAHYLATGKTNFLDIALKNAELIASVYGSEKRHDAPGHQEIEIGLAKLYRVTGDKKYLNLAKFFLDQRGKSDIRDYDSPDFWESGAYWQDHKPVVEQDEAVGHAVRAVYMYSAMADVAALTGDQKYLDAIKKIWENVVSKKYYITGGIGARYDGEAFGNNYELPNRAYNETCAAIANIFWNHRMFLMTGESKYIDVLERTLYNGMLSGISLEGNTFFYPNVLEFDGYDPFNQGATSRKPWFNCSCCPSNIARFIPAVPGYLYAVKDDQVFANLFASCKSEISINKKTVFLNQETNYPWDGNIKFIVNVEEPTQFVLNLRIPGWVKNQPVPSDLYAYTNKTFGNVGIKVNGKEISADLVNGYFPLNRNWESGDVIEMVLPMAVKKVIPHKNVKEIARKVAIERGPIVYCAEQVDNPDGVLNLSVSENEKFEAEFINELNGIVKLTSNSGKTLIPYYAWSHREPGEMEVWFNRN